MVRAVTRQTLDAKVAIVRAVDTFQDLAKNQRGKLFGTAIRAFVGPLQLLG